MSSDYKVHEASSKSLPKTVTLEKELTDVLTRQLDECILRSQKYLLNAQFKDGYKVIQMAPAMPPRLTEALVHSLTTMWARVPLLRRQNIWTTP